MNTVARALWNPIVAKEYRARMRTWRSPAAITVYVVLLGGIGWAVFSAIANNAFGGLQNYGQTLFTFLILFQVALLAFITPALTAGAISGERERQTIDLLFVTPLPAFSIIWGKLLASMSFVVLLLILSVPIFSLVFLFGGIELDQVVQAFTVTGVTALTLGLVGIAFSSFFRRSLLSTVAAYGGAFVLMAGTLLYGLLLPTEWDVKSTKAPAPPAVALLSPVLPLFTIATGQPIPTYGVRTPTGPYLAASSGGGGCYTAPDGTTSCYSNGVAQPSPIYPGQVFSQATGTRLPSGIFEGWEYWEANVVMQLSICLVALVFSALVLPPVRRFRLRLRRAPATA